MQGDFGSCFDICQKSFHQRWNQLNDPHVRALAWLLDAPDLLDPLAPQWHGKIASLSGTLNPHLVNWLTVLDHEPEALHTALNAQYCARLGRYAEKLMAFYFAHQGTLVAHGVQVHAGKNNTIGEFDFLLRQGAQGLAHWEFATKFYLLAKRKLALGGGIGADYFVGPNLADSLDAKMRKILDQQLLLGQHPAAQEYLPEPVTSAQALVKGWLFYHRGEVPQQSQAVSASGVSSMHCRGFWCGLSQMRSYLSTAEHYCILPRLTWLAPAKVLPQLSCNQEQLQATMTAHFSQDTMPVLMAILQPHGDFLLESRRGFIVPDDWSMKAEQTLY